MTDTGTALPPFVTTNMSPGTMSPGTNLDTQVLDAEHAGATPEVEPEFHINPYQAAKDLRVFARDLRNLAEGFTGGKPQVPNSDFLDAAMGYLVRVESEHAGISDAIYSLGSRLGEVHEAIESRRVSEGREVLERLRALHTNLRHHHARAATRLVDAKANLAGAKKQQKPAASPSESTRKRIMLLCDEIHRYAQTLPTIPNAPLNPAENQLRAVATLLLNGGYLHRNSKGQFVLGEKGVPA